MMVGNAARIMTHHPSPITHLMQSSILPPLFFLLLFVNLFLYNRQHADQISTIALPFDSISRVRRINVLRSEGRRERWLVGACTRCAAQGLSSWSGFNV